MKIKAIITGATGMVGEGVLHECLKDPNVESVLVVGRRSVEVSHPKLEEIVHSDFFDLSPLEPRLAGYNACFFCLGVSSIGLTEDQYRRLTYDLTMNFAQTLARLNPAMTFCYVSGKGTDSTEKGKVMWARVKGKTENDLMKLPFEKVFAFRPGYMQPTPGLKRANKAYAWISWMYPVLRKMFPKSVCSLEEMGRGMIGSVSKKERRGVVEVEEIVGLAEELD